MGDLNKETIAPVLCWYENAAGHGGGLARSSLTAAVRDVVSKAKPPLPSIKLCSRDFCFPFLSLSLAEAAHKSEATCTRSMCRQHVRKIRKDAKGWSMSSRTAAPA